MSCTDKSCNCKNSFDIKIGLICVEERKRMRLLFRIIIFKVDELTSNHFWTRKKWTDKEKDQIKTRKYILSYNGNCVRKE